jgi:hypothetical protein
MVVNMAEAIQLADARFAVADDGTQWILQRREGERWRDISFVRTTRDVLARCLADLIRVKCEHPSDAKRRGLALLADLPEFYPSWRPSDTPSVAPNISRVSRRLPAHVVPDGAYLGMYRVCRSDGSFSDVVNLTRAADYARVVWNLADMQMAGAA